MTSDTRKGGRRLANRHDALFRALLEDPGRCTTLIREYLPDDIRALLSDEPPQLLDGTYVDEDMRTIQSDRLFQVRLKTGQPAFVYTLLEHKSAADPRTPLQLLGYQVRIWERYAQNRADRLRALPPNIPIVFYHGREPWTAPRSIFEAIDDSDGLRPFVRAMEYILHDLGRMETERLSEDATLRAGLAALKFAFSGGASVEELRRLLAALPDGDRFEIMVIQYIVAVHEMQPAALEEALRAAKPERWEALMGTVAEAWTKRALAEGEARGEARGKAEGLARGEARGKAEGLAEGEAKSLTRLLERRFGPLPGPVRDRITAASLEQLDTWLDAILDAPSLEALFGEPDIH